MYLFTSESVSAGHPDKCADIIADTIVDRLLQLESDARVATEVFLSGKRIVIGGEVRTTAPVSEGFYRLCAIDALRSIGYPERGFDETQTLYPEAAEILVFVSKQSADISIGVDKESGELGAGDQGMMIGFATDETDSYIPAPLAYARRIRDTLYAHARRHPDLSVSISRRRSHSITAQRSASRPTAPDRSIRSSSRYPTPTLSKSKRSAPP